MIQQLKCLLGFHKWMTNEMWVKKIRCDMCNKGYTWWNGTKSN